MFQLNNDETPRFGSEVAEKYQKAYQALNLLLPGTAFVYYGDEIAMTNGVVNGAANKDPLSAAGKVHLQLPFHITFSFKKILNF